MSTGFFRVFTNPNHMGNGWVGNPITLCAAEEKIQTKLSELQISIPKLQLQKMLTAVFFSKIQNSKRQNKIFFQHPPSPGMFDHPQRCHLNQHFAFRVSLGRLGFFVGIPETVGGKETKKTCQVRPTQGNEGGNQCCTGTLKNHAFKWMEMVMSNHGTQGSRFGIIQLKKTC